MRVTAQQTHNNRVVRGVTKDSGKLHHALLCVTHFSRPLHQEKQRVQGLQPRQ